MYEGYRHGGVGLAIEMAPVVRSTHVSTVVGPPLSLHVRVS
jgi:hypothetical protein